MRLEDYNNSPPEKDRVNRFIREVKKGITASAKAYKPSDYYSPSSMRCARNMWFKRKKEIPERSSFRPYWMEGITSIGNFRHEGLQDVISNLNYEGFEWVDIEEYIAKKDLDYLEFLGSDGAEARLKDHRYRISFRCDGLIKLGDEYYVLEIKTESHIKFNKLAGTSPEHKAQITSYCNSLGVDKALFIYESRSNSKMLHFIEEVTEEDKLALVEKLRYVEECYQLGVVAKSEKSTINCQFCKYKEKCKEIGYTHEEVAINGRKEKK